MIENKHFIKGISSRITGLENDQTNGLSPEPVRIKIAQDEIDWIWPMSFEENRVELRLLQERIKKIQRIEMNRPRWVPRPMFVVYG